MAEQEKRESGTVSCYYPLKGYGFIRRDKGKDIFFFRDDASSEEILLEGAFVTFILKLEAKGPRAYNIERKG